MRLPSRRRRRLTAAEHLLGRRRARRLRRRLGLAALGTGLVLLRPRHPWRSAVAGVLLAVVVAMAAGGALAVMR